MLHHPPERAVRGGGAFGRREVSDETLCAMRAGYVGLCVWEGGWVY